MKQSVLQNSLQLLAEIRQSLINNKLDVQQQPVLKTKKTIYQPPQEQYIPTFAEIEPQNTIPDSFNMTSDLLDQLRTSQQQFEKQCSDLDNKIKELMDSVDTEFENEQPPVMYKKNRQGSKLYK